MAIRVCEVSVIENIEDLPPELEIFAFGESNLFVDREIPLVKPRSAAYSSLGSNSS